MLIELSDLDPELELSLSDEDESKDRATLPGIETFELTLEPCPPLTVLDAVLNLFEAIGVAWFNFENLLELP